MNNFLPVYTINHTYAHLQYKSYTVNTFEIFNPTNNFAQLSN